MISLINALLKTDSPDSNEKKQQHTNLISREGTIRRLKRSPEARAKFVESNLSKELAFQIRALRDNKEWSQPELAEKVGTSQNAISRLENPNYGKATITTLKKLASVFDVGLVVRFVPFSQLVNWESGTPYTEYGLSPESMDVPSFTEELPALERQSTEVIGAGYIETESTNLYGLDFKIWGDPVNRLRLRTTSVGIIGLTMPQEDVYMQWARLAYPNLTEEGYVKHLAQEGKRFSVETTTTSEVVGEAAFPVKKRAESLFLSGYTQTGSA